MLRNFIGLFVAVMLVLGVGTTTMGQIRDMDLEDRWIVPDPTTPPPGDDDDDDDQGFGGKVAGSWLGSGSFGLDFDCDGVADLPGFGVFTADAHTFDVGGSHTATNPNNPNLGHGTWEKTGARQLTGRDAIPLPASDAEGLPIAGTLDSIAMVSFVIDFDQSFESATDTFGARVYTPDQDPLNPNETPVICTVGTHDSFRKVSAE